MKKLLLTLVLSIFLMTSCANQPSLSDDTGGNASTAAASPATSLPDSAEATTVSEDIKTSQTALITVGELTPKDIGKLYPDKTVLVWVLPDFYRTELEVNTEVNEYLDSLGKDYAVYFKMLNYFSEDGEYIDLVKKRISEGEPVDILYSAEISEDSSMTFSYHSYVSEGLFEPLNGYFSDTEIGRKLYNQMPENYWKLLTVDGKIYAADGNSENYSRPSGYCVNKELAEKYGFDIYKPILEQLDVLEKVKKGEPNCDIVFFPTKMGNSAYYPEVFEGLKGIVYDYDTDSLIRLTEDKSFLERLSEINNLASRGYVNSNNNIRAETFFVSFAVTDAIAVGDIGSETIKYHADGTPIEAVNVYSTNKISFKTPNTATGVCSYSGNKDMAFDLLATVMTDRYLNDLLAGGENGQFAVVFSDKFKNEAVSSIIGDNEPENHNLMYLSVVDEAELPPFIGFCFDVSPVDMEYGQVKSVLMNYDFAQAKDVERILADINSKLDEAGIDAVLDEVNRQYHEWRNSH